MRSVPGASAFDHDQKTFVVLQDLEYENMNTTERWNLERLFGYVATHKNVHVKLAAQDPCRLIRLSSDAPMSFSCGTTMARI